jgi:Xaa-Pro aminopeptidase
MGDRIAELQQALKKHRLNFMVVTSDANIRWLIGGPEISAVFVIPAKGEPMVITSDFERLRLPKNFKPLMAKRKWWRAIAKITGRSRIGFEDAALSVRGFERARKFIKGKLIPASAVLTKLREVKSKDELAKIKKALSITEAGMEAGRRAIRPGITERQLAAVTESAMRRAGADWYAFDSIIASGPRTASPHQGIADRKIGLKDMIIIDIGAMVDGWCSDMTRTFCLKPGQKEKKIYETVLKMREAALKKIYVGQKASVVDGSARAVARKLGLEKAFTHGLGHGVGAEIHENPSVSQRSKDRFRKGNVFTIEPGLYFEGWGGVRIEDMFLLTRKGPVLLTKFPRRLIP